MFDTRGIANQPLHEARLVSVRNVLGFKHGSSRVRAWRMLSVAALLALCAPPALGQGPRPTSLAPAPSPHWDAHHHALARAASESQPAPAWVTYSFFFNHLAHLDDVADEQEALGNEKAASGWRTYEQRAAALTDDEGRVLKQVAYACNQAVKDQDVELRKAIDAFRERVGKSPRLRDASPAVPEEPVRLWGTRTQIIEAHVDELRSRLGSAASERLDRYLLENFQPELKSVPNPQAVGTNDGEALRLNSAGANSIVGGGLGVNSVSDLYIYVYSHSTPGSGLQALSECGTSMTDASTAANYPAVIAVCGFYSSVRGQLALFSCGANPSAICRYTVSNLLSGESYATAGGHSLNLYSSPICSNLYPNFPYYDPFQYSLPFGQPLPVFTESGYVPSHGPAVCGDIASAGLAQTQGVPFTIGPQIKVTPGGGDFGEVPLNASLDGDFYVQNQGDGILTGTASTSEPYSIVSGDTYSLAAGMSQTVTVRFKPTAVGTFNKNITFTGGGGATRPVTGKGVLLRELGIAASGTASAVSINVTPHDYDFKLGGTTPFVLRYPDGTVVTVTAPSVVGTDAFSNWTGCTSSSGTTCTVTVNGPNMVVTAVYGTAARTLGVFSSPANGASITVTPVDRNNAGNGVTPFSRIYDLGKVVTLVATAPSGYTFSGWLGCDSATGATCTVTMSADKNVTAAYAVIPARKLTVSSSNPASGVAVTVSPNDKSGQGNGTTQFIRTFNNGTSVTLVAPPTAGTNAFSSWSGCDSSPGATCTVTMNADKSVTATYAAAPVRTLTVASSNPPSGVAISVSPNDKSGAGNGTTQFTRTFNNGTVVTLGAPTTFGSNTFSSWSGCDSSPGTTCTVTMSADKTVTANFAPPRTLTVTSSPTGASIPVSPADRNSKTNGTTPFTLSYNNNQVVTITAPDSLPDGSNAPAWSGCDGGSGATCIVTVNADKTVTAVYRMPIIRVSRIRPTQTHVIGPRSTTAVVDLSAAAPTGGASVTLSSDSGTASVPPNVIVPSGATSSPPFTVGTTAVSVSTPVTITANYQGTVSVTIYVDPVPYEGYLDGADCNTVWGWAWDASLPNTPINVDLYDGSSNLTTIAANAFRQDLLNAGKGNGYHGFFWTVPQSLKNGASHSISARFGGTQIALIGSPRAITCTPPSVSVAWIRPAEVTWGPAGTLTVAGYAQNGTGGVHMAWHDVTFTNTAWSEVGWDPVPDTAHQWSNTIPSSNNCHIYEVRATYWGVTTYGTYNGLTAGYCSEYAGIIWVQPGYLAGFGPSDGLVLAGSASGAPAGTLVQLFWRDATMNTGWYNAGYTSVDAHNIWYHSIPSTNFAHVYEFYVQYDALSSRVCDYAGNSAMNWCP